MQRIVESDCTVQIFFDYWSVKEKFNLPQKRNPFNVNTVVHTFFGKKEIGVLKSSVTSDMIYSKIYIKRASKIILGDVVLP